MYVREPNSQDTYDLEVRGKLLTFAEKPAALYMDWEANGHSLTMKCIARHSHWASLSRYDHYVTDHTTGKAEAGTCNWFGMRRRTTVSPPPPPPTTAGITLAHTCTAMHML